MALIAMLHDTFPPPPWDQAGSPAVSVLRRPPISIQRAEMTPFALEARLLALADRGAEALREVGSNRLAAAWQETVAAFLDPAGEERSRLAAALGTTTGLSPEGLDAALETVLRGVEGDQARAMFAAGSRRPAPASPLAIFLAGNLPALAVQPLLPALASARPVLLKSPSAEPFFAPAFAAALASREPLLGEALTACCWSGGDADVEAPVLRLAGKIIAYGEADSLDDLSRRSAVPVVRHGPRLSFAAVGPEASPTAIAEGLAKDIALFDQRGCLSVQAVFAVGDAETLAPVLADALADAARRWPPGRAALSELAAVRQCRSEARLRGLPIFAGDIRSGTVVVEPDLDLAPSPGLRTVRIYPLADLQELPRRLARWQGRLQGVALAGVETASITADLRRLGVTRVTPPGELQRADALWRNGGLDPLEAVR